MLLVAATIAIYSPVFHHPFENYDTPEYVYDNPHIRDGLTWQTLKWAMTSSYAGNWHPLTWMSHALDYQLYGLDPGGHHATTVILHALNALLLFLLLSRVTGALGRSAMVAALFTLHPFNVESVAWVAERKNVLSALFFFLALGAYGWYARQPSVRRYLLVVATFIMGLASKPMVITLPFVLLLLDYWPLARIESCSAQSRSAPSPAFPVAQAPFWRLVREKIPLFALSAASAVITIVAQESGHAVDSLSHTTLALRLENAAYSYLQFLVKTFFPIRLAVLYPHPLHLLPWWKVALALLVLTAITVWVWRRRSTNPFSLVGWLWFLGTMVPMIGIVQVGAQAMADRYAYLPIIGVFLMVVWESSNFLESRHLSPFAGTIAVSVLAILSVITVRQIGYWASSEELWTHTLQVTENNFIADDKLGLLLIGQGRPEGMDYFYDAARIFPYDYVSRGEIAAALQDQGKLQDALREYEKALQYGPDPSSQAFYYCNMGVIYRELGDTQRARESFAAALSADAEEVQNKIMQISRAAARQPGAPIYWRLGLLLEGVNRPVEAESAYRQALVLDPNFAPARVALQALQH